MNKLHIEPIKLEGIESLKGGVEPRINGCLIANGKCVGENSGCGIANGQCTSEDDPPPPPPPVDPDEPEK